MDKYPVRDPNSTAGVVLAEFFRDHHGDKLMLRIESSYGLDCLSQLFQNLAEGKIDEFNLCSAAWAKCGGSLSHLLLKLSPRRIGPQSGLRATQDASQSYSLEWSRDSEGWLENLELLNGLTRPGHHQYLSYGSYSASIEVSYLENLAASDGADRTP
jgi:hypothetical protein